MARIRKGDTVAVLSGKERGKRGKVLRMNPSRELAMVERLNLMKHFERRSQQQPAGGIVEREGWLPLAKLSVVCPSCHEPTRVAWMVGQDGTKRRVCRRCQGTC